MIAVKGGASEPPNMQLPGKARGTVAVRRTLAYPLSAGSPIRRRFLDRGSSATNHGHAVPTRASEYDQPSFQRPRLLPCPEELKTSACSQANEFSRLHLAKADMRVDRF
jgi:hypothetical protein